jgi:hypothetical protein
MMKGYHVIFQCKDLKTYFCNISLMKNIKIRYERIARNY